VLDSELKEIDARRQKRGQSGQIPGQPPPPEEPWKNAHERQLVGLAFSGGGIRSATFNLGVLQGLAGMGLLKIVDYLSTVSGGSYIGAWLAAWMKHEGVDKVEGQLLPNATPNVAPPNEPEQIRHLRRHSNYLAPRQGYMSSDRWVIAAIYLRNFLLNQLVLLPALLLVLLFSRFLMFAYYPTTTDESNPLGGQLYTSEDKRVPLMPGLSVFLLISIPILAAFASGFLFHAIGQVRWPGRPTTKPKGPGWLLWLVVLPLGLAAFLSCRLIPNELPFSVSGYLSDYLSWVFLPDNTAQRPWYWPTWAETALLFSSAGALTVGLGYFIAGRWQREFSWPIQGWCFLIGLAWGLMLFGSCWLLRSLYPWDSTEPLSSLIAATAHMTTFGPALILGTLVPAISLAIGLLRNQMKEGLREWLASLCAWFLMACAGWILLNVIALYATPLVLWAGPWVQAILASGWLLTMVGGVLAGSGSRTGAKEPINTYRELFVLLSPSVFAIGILVLVSLLLHFAIDTRPDFRLADQSIWPFRYEPDPAPTRVTVNRTGKEGRVSIQRKQEFLRIPDEAATQLQQYWLSIFNTKEKSSALMHFNYYLAKADEAFLNSKGVPVHRLAQLRRPKFWNSVEFRERLDANLKDGVPDEIKDEILRLSLSISHASSVGLSGSPLGQGTFLAVSAVFPSPAEKPFMFSLDFLKGSRVPDSVQENMEGLQYDAWEAEELQDKIDELFPMASEQPLRRLIFQRLKGAVEPDVKLDRSKFWWKIGGCMAGCALLLLIAASRVDVNAFSMHGMYLNRLVRAYLGGARAGLPQRPDPAMGFDPDDPGRKPDPLTRFDPDDDLLLGKLNASDSDRYHGPYPIINTALNLVHGEKLDWQERKAESFVLTPQYCGSESTGYRRTVDGGKKYAGGVKLGTAVTISGAAASPNMGYHSSPAVTFLLTVFNARLGAWLGNPKNSMTWTARGPRWGLLYLFRELFGWTKETSPYVYLSDGGHFENLGVYELIKRRCRYIIVSDAGQDADHTFEDLGNLIRKVRIDLQVPIDVDLEFMRLQRDPRRCRWHCAIGRIRYDLVDKNARPGTLVYIKPSLTGDEPGDVLHYAASHSTFPHETTANQFYTESQFESYRTLGQHVVEKVLGPSVADMDEEDERYRKALGAGDLLAQRHRRCEALFSSLVRRWFATPPEYEASFLQTTQAFIDMQQALRRDPHLWRLTRDLYPELSSLKEVKRLARLEKPADREARCTAELHAITQMIQIMENAWLGLKLDVNYAHPMNRGWMDIFHRWTSAETVRSHWPLLRAEFGRDFVRFCEHQMRLGVIEGRPKKLRPNRRPRNLDRLLQEFKDQWPDKVKWLRKLVKSAGEKKQGPHVWLIHPEYADSRPQALLETGGTPAGIIAVTPDETFGSQPQPPRDYVLFVWLRGAYRNTGLGRTAVSQVLSQLGKLGILPLDLRVRLPRLELTGPGGKLQEDMWLTFFYHHGFVRTEESTSENVVLWMNKKN
jgi:hypothetical protein